MSLNNSNKGSNGQKEQKDLLIAEQEQDLPVEIEDKKKKGTLRSGYTTGTCAAAATKASLLAMLSGKKVSTVDVSLPKGREAKLIIAWTRINTDSVTSCVVKDAGDD